MSRARSLADFFGRQDAWSGSGSRALKFLRGDGSWQQAGSTDAGDLTGVLPAGVTGGSGLAISTASQTALDLKAPIASPTFTGTVGGISVGAASIGDGVLPVGVTGGSGLDAVAVGAANVGAGIFPSDVETAYDESRGRNHGTKKWHTRCTSASPANTFTLMRFSRWWWGNCYGRIQVHEYRYGPDSRLFDGIVYGHTRSGNPSIYTITNTGAPTPYFTDYDGGRERSQLKLSGATYREYVVEWECNGMAAADTDALCGPNGGGSDCYYWHSQEQIG